MGDTDLADLDTEVDVIDDDELDLPEEAGLGELDDDDDDLGVDLSDDE